MSLGRILGWGACGLTLCPALWLLVRREREAAYWWLAGGFGVALLSDLPSAFGAPWRMMGLLYPFGQAALTTAVFQGAQDRWRTTVMGLGAVAVVAVYGWRPDRPDWLLHIMAWGSIVAVVWKLWALGWLRVALLIYYGLGMIAYIGFSQHITWRTWGMYQGVKLSGILIWCYAVAHDRPRLRIA